MKIDVFKRVKNENLDVVKFVLDGVSVELANAFRRLILTEVPSMAITEVLFVENDTVLFDELIAHRLGLIPLTTDLKNYNLPDECSCGGQGCTLCQAQLMLEVHAENTKVNAYSKDLESMDPKVEPVNGNILIAKLGKKSSLVLEAYAQLGRGKDHAKYQPVCSIGYKYYPDVKIDLSKFSKDPEERQKQFELLISKDQTNLFTIQDGELSLVENYWQGPDFTHALEKFAPAGGITIDDVPNKFVFTVEATGALPLKDIFKVAVDVFLEKLDEFEDQLRTVPIEKQIKRVTAR